MHVFAIVLPVLAGALAVLFLIAAVRALCIKARPVARQSALSHTPAEEARYAESLARLVRIPTVSVRGSHDAKAFARLHAEMRVLFPTVFSRMELTELSGNLLLRLPGADPAREGVMLMGHQDVVPAKERGWTHGPFAGDIADGRVYGRGAADCKDTVCAEFLAMEELLCEGYTPPCDVYLSCSVDEEVSGGGAKKLAALLRERGVRLHMVLDEGGAIVDSPLPGLSGYAALCGVVEKGYNDVRIIARGNGGHASSPPKHSPLARLAAFICEVEKKPPFVSRLTEPVRGMFAALAPHLSYPMRFLFGNLWLFGPLLPWLLPKTSPYGAALMRTTAAFTMCTGSAGANVLPDEASVLCNLRASIQQDSRASVAALTRIAQKHGLTVELLCGENASRTVDTAAAPFVYLRSCVDACFPGLPFAPYYIMGGTDCRNYESVSDSCLRFCPIRTDAQQLAAMHAANENVFTDALADCVKFYRYFLTHLA